MPKPKISLNKLGEYLDATPARRRQIIKDQQNPRAFKAARYQDARKEIVDFIASDMQDDAKLLKNAQVLRETTEGTEYFIQDKIASADAIESFLEFSDNLNLENTIAESVEKTDRSIMECGGVDISIRPDVILKDRETNEIKGAIRFHFPKSTPLSEKSLEYVAVAVKHYLTESYPSSAIDYKDCLAIDISTQKIIHATKTHKKKMNDIEAACQEIDARWKKDER